MKTGLILVDIQNEYFPGGKVELVGIKEAANNASTLLALFRENKMPTVHVQHISASENAPVFTPNSTGIELYEGIKPEAGERVIQKHFPNSFRETSLSQVLNEEGVQQVVICGAMSHMCIDATTRAAADLGFKCIVIHDACATRNLEFRDRSIHADDVHASFMAALGSAYATVISLDEFISEFNNSENK